MMSEIYFEKKVDDVPPVEFFEIPEEVLGGIPEDIQQYIANCKSTNDKEGIIQTTDDDLVTSFFLNTPVQISVHSCKDDQYVSCDIRNKGCFECDIVHSLLAALKDSVKKSSKMEGGIKRKPPILIDIGGNIGMYSLFAASMGIQTYVFEPFLINWQRICHSLHSNIGFEKLVKIFSVALSDKESILQLDLPQRDQTNKGAVRVKAFQNENDMGNLAAKGQEGRDFVHAITLDKFSEILPKDRLVVLKIDVEGHECEALAGAMKYLSKVSIAYVGIEWSLQRLQQCRNREEIFELFGKNNLKPYMHFNETWEELDPGKYTNWKQRGRFPVKGLYDIAWAGENPRFIEMKNEIK